MCKARGVYFVAMENPTKMGNVKVLLLSNRMKIVIGSKSKVIVERKYEYVRTEFSILGF